MSGLARKQKSPRYAGLLVFPYFDIAGWTGGERLYGAGNRNRTCDLLITNQSLYRLSYPGEGREL